MVKTQLHIFSSFLFVSFSLPQLPPAWLLLSGLRLPLLVEGLPPGSGLGTKSGLVAFHHCPALGTSILLKPVKRHLRGDSSVKLQWCGQFSEFTCDSQKAETGERPFLASPQTPQAHQRELLELIQYLPYFSFLLTSRR